ncbi:glycosyltransferase family 9 protein [Oceanisphaera avium]|uniref:ADP-heptose--LPS heptosyltransferase I n=1 Tax=Oceanisphaera avium TaxID=1903694 RepID=A0A1Y0CYF7_9GAMM|nr:glycosyltransferase family 9 protein [Oceanisphaera avium]ART80339.1 ADP-heptose--LPS heptosyltransferase I [Oceanisphaera avium]
MALFNSPPNSLCLLRLSAIGDCCHAIALVQAIQNQWPETHITWVTGKLEASLLCLLPNVEIIVFDKTGGLGAYQRLWQVLKGRKFDALLHMQAALRASIASLGIRAKYRLGFDKARAKDGQWLFTNYKVQPSGEHVVDGFMAFGQALGLHNITPSWTIDLPSEAIHWASSYQHLQPLLLICPGASKAYKNWTVAGYAKLADYAHRQGFKVVLVGSPAPQERALAHSICALTPHISENLVGKTSLVQLLALIKQARLVIAPDTGPTHMATLVGTPVLGLYAHHNPARTGPYYCRGYVVSAYEQALLAETGKTTNEVAWRTRVKDANAMELITLDAVITQLERMMSDFNLLQELNA